MNNEILILIIIGIICISIGFATGYYTRKKIQKILNSIKFEIK